MTEHDVKQDRVIVFYDDEGEEVGRVEAHEALPGFSRDLPPEATHIAVFWAGDIYAGT